MPKILKKVLEIKCDPTGKMFKMPWRKLESMQGDFKILDEEGRQTLRNSLEEVGFIAPFFVWYGKNFLLDGVQRTDVLGDMENDGWKIPDKLPVVSIEAKTRKEAIANIARFSSSHGIVTTQGAINLFGIEGLKLISPSIRIPQLNIPEIILQNTNHDETVDPGELIDRAAELNKKWKVKTGDIWTLGNHRLLCGDATKKEDVERLMDGKKADMVFTDPPYGVNYDGGASNKNKRERLVGDDQTGLFKPCCKMSFNYSSKNSPLYLWHAGTKGNAAAAAAAAIDAGYEIRCEIIWHKLKAHFGAFTAQYMQKHEPLYYCYKKGNSVNWCGASNEVTVWEIDQSLRNEFHPTQKPVELAIRAIKNHKVNIVADFFLGSGSTLIACEKTNRKCFGVEIVPGYCAVTLERWHEYTGQMPERSKS